MCSPVAALAGVGLGMQTAGAYQATKAENRSLEFNAAIMRQNAMIAEENARINEQRAADAVARGKIHERNVRETGERFKGRQRASAGASGVVVDSGSTQHVVEDTAAGVARDIMTTQYNTRMEEWGHLMSARADRMQGQQHIAQSRMTLASKRSPLLPAATTMLGGLTSMDRQFGVFR